MSELSESMIQGRLKEAMRSRATDEVMVLRGLVAAMKNLTIERRGVAGGAGGELGTAEITQILRREIKQREEAIAFAEQAGRADLVEKNGREKRYLETYLPQAVSAADLEAAIARHYEAGAASIGPLMGKLKAEFGARLDGKLASEAVREFLRRREGT
jgi:uncharacterized protein YqeY